jgi:hypothetical protein
MLVAGAMARRRLSRLVPPSQSQRVVAAARRAGDDSRLLEIARSIAFDHGWKLFYDRLEELCQRAPCLLQTSGRGLL